MKLSHLQRPLQRDGYQESLLSAAKWSVGQSTMNVWCWGRVGEDKSWPGCSPQERPATEGTDGLVRRWAR